MNHDDAAMEDVGKQENQCLANRASVVSRWPHWKQVALASAFGVSFSVIQSGRIPHVEHAPVERSETR